MSYLDLTELREIDRRVLPSYQQADLRDPVGLPLSEVWLGVTVEPTDFATGKQWPPQRAAGRAARFRDQHQAARGDYTAWLPTESTSASSPIARVCGTRCVR